MQATGPQPSPGNSPLGRKIGFLLLPPLLILVVVTLIFAFFLSQYRSEHDGRIYTGVRMGNIDLGGKTA